MNRNQSNNLPVAEIIECNVTGQQTIIEIEGRLKFLRIGDKLYTQPSQVAQPEQIEGDAKDAERYRFLRNALTSTDGAFYIGVDSANYVGRWALEGEEADQAIVAAIASQKGAV